MYGGAHLLPMLDKPLGRIPFVRGASIQPRDEVRLTLTLTRTRTLTLTFHLR